MEAPRLASAALSRLIDALITERVEGLGLGQRLSIEGLLVSYLEALHGEGRRPRYVQDVGASIRHVVGFLAVRRLDELDAGSLLRYRAAVISSGRSARTAEKKTGAVLSWLTWLAETGVAPCSLPKVRRLRVREDQLRHERRALSATELDRYLAAHQKLDQADQERSARAVPQLPLYLALAVSACRWGELSQATWGALDGQALEIAAADSKSRRARHVPLSPQAARRLGALRELHRTVFGFGRPSDPIFLGPRGIGRIKHRPALRRHDAALALAGIPRRDAAGRVVDLHALRVSCITGWLEAGLAISEAQALAGHRDIRVTAGYCRHQPGAVLRRADSIARAFPALDAEASDCGALPFPPHAEPA
jgi:integrase